MLTRKNQGLFNKIKQIIKFYFSTAKFGLKINDSLNVNKDIVSNGDITSKGEMTATDTMRAKENIIAQKDIKVDGSIYVGDKLEVNGNINTSGHYSINNKPVISISSPPIGIPTDGPSVPYPPVVVSYGPSGPFTILDETCSTGQYNPWTVHNFGGLVQIYDNSGNGVDYNPEGSILKMQAWQGQSSIDVSGGNAGGGNTGLLMNYFCGKNIAMCTGALGGIVSMGKNVEIGMPTASDNSVALNINASGAQAWGIRLFNKDINHAPFSVLSTGRTYIGPASPTHPRQYNLLSVSGEIDCKSFFVYNPTLQKGVFEVKSDGTTYIGIGRPKAGGAAATASLTVDGLILAKEIKVAIANTHWADYVFDKDYKLISLNELEQFILKNKHLPEVPSFKTVEEEGIDVVETNATLLKKIEELTLYLIEQNKRLEKLEKEKETLLKGSK